MISNQKIVSFFRTSALIFVLVVILSLFLFGKNKNYQENYSQLADLKCEVSGSTTKVYGEEGAYTPVVTSCPNDFNRTGVCYQRGVTVDPSNCGPDDGVDCYEYIKYNIKCSECNVTHCALCSSNDRNKCSRCETGYHISNGKCVQDSSSCPEGQGKDSFGSCTNCAAGYWSEAGSVSCSTKCPEDYACKNGRKVKCDVATPEGSSECYTCDVANCKKCEKYKKDVCATCKSGYSLSASGKCNNSSGSSSSSSACYKNTANNEYVYGQYGSLTGYTKVSDEDKKCNKVLIKLVDDNKLDLQGAIISVTSHANPTSPMTYNIGSKELELLEPGMYTIKETAAPANYQIDSASITLNIDNAGIITVTSSSTLIDLGTTNSSRNVTIIWQNLLNPSIAPPEEEEEEQCYTRHEGDAENSYCFGKKDACSDYDTVLEGRDNSSCNEDIACYKASNDEFISGKYANREGYKYYASVCPNCYRDKGGNLAWGSFENVEGYTVEPTIKETECHIKVEPKTSSDNSKLKYIILIAVIVIAIIFIFFKGKPKKGNTSTESESDDEDYNYNYRI